MRYNLGMEAAYELEVFETDNGRAPFLTWQAKLGQKARDIVTARLARLRVGNFGDAKMIRGCKGLYELRIHEGPGYRVYFGRRGKRLILLLCGGAKGTQKRDIERAKGYWAACVQAGKK